MSAIKEGRSAFIERWSNVEIVNARLGIVVFILAGLCLALAGGLIFMAVKPKPIYFITSLESGIAYPKGLSDGAIGIFASSWVLDWTNFTPATVNDAYKRAQQWMSPGLLTKTKVRLNKDLDEVKNNNISSQFSISQDPKVIHQGNIYRVVINGEKGMFMGKENINQQSAMYTLSLRKVNPTDNNPCGLIVEDVDQEIVRK